MADATKAAPTTPATVYHWWSMTKIPTAIAILQLQEHGLLSLDDLVQTHLPWFKVQYPSGSSQPLTVRHLLNHSCRVCPTPCPPSSAGCIMTTPVVTKASWRNAICPPFRNCWILNRAARAVYSNLDYMLLGAVIEAVSGQSYEAYVTQNVLKPLRMEQSGFVYTEAMAAHKTAGTLPGPLLYALAALLAEHQQADPSATRRYLVAQPASCRCHTTDRADRPRLRYGTLDAGLSQPQ